MTTRLAAIALSLGALAAARGVGSQQAGGAEPNSSFVGAQACASCHRQIHERWSGGRHSRMVQPAGAASVVGDFSSGAVTLHGRTYQLRVSGGQYFISEPYLTGAPKERRVEFTLGSRRVQHYLATLDNGRIVVLPPSWNVERREWFDNMDIVGPAAADRTPVQQWNKDCVGCHVSGEQKNFNPDTGAYATRWSDFGTTCERCHGPARAHLERYSRQQRRNIDGDDRSIVRPTRLDPATSSMICAQCHSLRNVINPNYAAGADYYDFFNPRLEYDPGNDRELPYWPDGRPRRFSNDAIGLWQSECFLRGQATCTTCHRDPHEPNVDRDRQLGASANALCTGCHAPLRDRLTEHTRHAATSRGSSCVDCHMPKTVISLNATMRDHTISVPAPENTAAFGIPNACTECHADRKPSWAVATLAKWWPNGRRARLVARARAFAGARRAEPAALQGLRTIAADPTNSPLIRATAVGYLRRYPGDQARDALLRAARAEHPAIRAAALAGLGEGWAADDASAREILNEALSDPRRAVRIAALVAVINGRGRPTDPAAAARLAAVGREFAELSVLYEDDAGFNRDLGTVHLLSGDFDPAAHALEICLRLDAKRPSAAFLLALARLGQGRTLDARLLLERVPASDPSYAAAQRRLKEMIR